MNVVSRLIAGGFIQLLAISRLITKNISKLDLTSIPFEQHIFISCIVRLTLIIYGVIQDNTSEIQYTDIDYKVVTDGARYVLNNESPFRRHTYRYSPLLAYLMLPNLLIHETFGKVLFSSCDVLASILIRNIVYNELKVTFLENSTKSIRNRKDKQRMLTIPEKFIKWSEKASYMWLHNPVGMIISTRGNSDAIVNLLILTTIFYIQKENAKIRNYFLAGVAHGFAIHIRIFPIIFSLALFLNIAEIKWQSSRDLLKAILLPNKKQLALTFGTVFSLFILTYLFYLRYGNEYIHEAYLYHFTRIDTRHNYSLYFLMHYLNANESSSFLDTLLLLLPKMIVIFYFSITFGLYRKTLSFCIFAQTFVFVTYNTVVTAQYFAWYLALLPLCARNFRNITGKLALTYFVLWLLAQGLWLLLAFLLEFKCWNTFNLIGIQCIVFFLINIFILHRAIANVNEISI